MNVSVLGASPNPERYSHMAVKMLAEKGHTVFPVHPKSADIAGIPAFKSLAEIVSPVHTITVYVAPERSIGLAEEILSARPKRVIFNPGAENGALAKRLRESGIETLEACTLVLLRTGQFETDGIAKTSIR
jgi:predicted CoA-binding protein